MALTSEEPWAAYPLTLELTAAKLPKRSCVKISQIRTLSTERIGKRLGRASDEELAQVLDGCLKQSDRFSSRRRWARCAEGGGRVGLDLSQGLSEVRRVLAQHLPLSREPSVVEFGSLAAAAC